MAIEVKVPLLPESVQDATISTWHKKVGDKVSRDENILDLETDKVMLEVPSPSDGILVEIKKQTGSVVHAEEVVAVIDASASAQTQPRESKATPISPTTAAAKTDTPPLSPSVRKVAAEHDVDVSKIAGTGKNGRLTKENVMSAIDQKAPSSASTSTPTAAAAIISAPPLSGDRIEKRVPMTRMRARIAERLLEVSQTTAMLTTFNEVNMQAVMDMRQRYRDKFEKVHHARLGFMSFFVKACVEALKRIPAVNASIDGNDIVYHGYYDIGVAVSTERGLVVPVLRNADKMSMAEIEMKIVEYADKARSNKLTLEEMQGGTFTITNGGVFGSLLATPLLNSPQSAILGMHKIQERAVVENGQIVIRPMMYLALSYDHRIIDGKESVTFLVAVKELLEDPTRFLLEV